MGLSSSSLLDETKSSFIKGRAQAELQNFAPFYKKQYTLAYLSHVHEELVQRKEEHTQLLKQREPPNPAKVLYEEYVLYFDDHKKWKERYAVVRANYSLECHENCEAYLKGTPPLYKLLPTGGTVLTTEEKYMEIVDKCFPKSNSVKEDFAPPLADMPGDFPVYLRLPYRRDYYFCCSQDKQQTRFICALSDCIRHQNQDFLKKKSYEVQAFMKAIQLYRQEKGHYETWDMLIGSDVRVLANLIMEELLPSLEKDWLPRLKTKKTERKKTWFAMVEEVYYLVQETLMEGMTALKDACKEKAKKQSALMRSDMDQIMSSRAFLESKLRATVVEPTSEYCMEHVEPHLPAILEELMGPISLGFKEAQELSEAMMEQLCKDYQKGMTKDKYQQAFTEMSNPNLQSCYEKVSGLKDHIKELQQSFSNPNSKGLEHSTQIDIQQLVQNVAYTFELLLHKAEEENKNIADTMVKAKQRVLKQYDYDSSTVRKRIFQEALINITLPSIKAHIGPTFKKELPTFEQYIFSDYVPFINVENVYEDILQQILEKEVGKVVKEAAKMKKYNLFTESRYHFSTSSLQSTPPGSIPGSPGNTGTSPSRHHVMRASPLLGHGFVGVTDTAGQEAKAVEPELVVPKQAEVQPYTTHMQMELAEVPASVQAGGGHKTEEKKVVDMSLSAETEINLPSIKPHIFTVHPTIMEETTEPTPTTNECLKVGENTKAESVKPTFLSTEILVEPSSFVNAESTLKTAVTPQMLVELIPKGVERASNGMPMKSSSTEEDTEPLDQVLQSKETYTGSACVSVETKNVPCGGSVDEPDPHSKVSLIAPSAGEEDKSSTNSETEVLLDDPLNGLRDSETTRDEAPADDESLMTENQEVLENANGFHPTTVGVDDKHHECLIVKCEAIADAEANTEASADPAISTDCSANKSPQASATTESAANPQPTTPVERLQTQPSPCNECKAGAPTEAQPATRPPDCVKEIRDLVVEVIEVEEIVQRYPDNGDV